MGAGGEGAARGVRVTVEVGPGELLDRIARLQVALERGGAPPGLAGELAALMAARDAALPASARLDALAEALAEVEAELAALRADLAGCEARGDFGPAFAALARAVEPLRDRRAALRAEVDALLAADPGPGPRGPLI